MRKEEAPHHIQPSLWFLTSLPLKWWELTWFRIKGRSGQNGKQLVVIYLETSMGQAVGRLTYLLSSASSLLYALGLVHLFPWAWVSSTQNGSGLNLIFKALSSFKILWSFLCTLLFTVTARDNPIIQLFKREPQVLWSQMLEILFLLPVDSSFWSW